MAEQRDGDVHHPVSAARLVEQRAEQHEQEHKARGDAERDADYELGELELAPRTARAVGAAALEGPDDEHDELYIAMEFRRFLHSIILIPCRVSRRARGVTLRLIGYQPTVDRLFSAWHTIERTGFT